MTPWLDDGDVRLYLGDNLDVLRAMPDRSVHMCATSPPFYGLRDYGTGLWEGGDPDCDHIGGTLGRQDAGRDFTGGGGNKQGSGNPGKQQFRETCGKCGARRVDQQIGLEDTPDQWVERLVAVFREVRRVLRDDGTLWVEIGDSYGSGPGSNRGDYATEKQEQYRTAAGSSGGSWGSRGADKQQPIPHPTKPKDLLGQPWLLAFALRADGWYLRSEIIWARPNPMPESVTDRPTKSHSTVFLLSKQPRYFYDADAIREAHTGPAFNGRAGISTADTYATQPGGGERRNALTQHRDYNPAGANARSVWQIPTQPTPFAHFATWPEALVRRMVLAGTSERGCCPECGAPWVRVTTSELAPTDRTPPPNGGELRGMTRAGNRTADGWVPNRDKTVTTVGWSPSCAHNTAPVPATVLDPFAGSATTCLVARNHGRHSIGIELNADYLTIAARRLQQLSLLA